MSCFKTEYTGTLYIFTYNLPSIIIRVFIYRDIKIMNILAPTIHIHSAPLNRHRNVLLKSLKGFIVIDLRVASNW